MSEPIAIPYNLGRLGVSGDQVAFVADAEQRAALARFAGVLEVRQFEARISLSKLSATRFSLAYAMTAELVQACVVTLEPLPAQVAGDFTRELLFIPNLRREPEKLDKEVTVSPEEDEAPEQIGSLHYDLAGSLTEEFVLAIDPYPRAPGVEFAPPEGAGDKPESPFAVLKGLKSGQ